VKQRKWPSGLNRIAATVYARSGKHFAAIRSLSGADDPSRLTLGPVLFTFGVMVLRRDHFADFADIVTQSVSSCAANRDS
jgi:hypothetical protein